jgi:hypothetical protein
MSTHIITAHYGAMPVLFQTDAFINAGQIARQFSKKANDYLKSDRTQDYIKAMSSFLDIKENQIVIVRNGAPETGGGTWLHPKLAIDFARWLSADFAVWCDMQIEKILHNRYQEQHCSNVPANTSHTEQLIEHDPERVVLLREIKTTTKTFIRCRNVLERETLSLVLQNLNHMAGFAEKLNPLVIAETPLIPATKEVINLTEEVESILEQFWNNYLVLNKQGIKLNHAKRAGEIAINLPFFISTCKQEKRELPERTQLFDALRDSRSPYPQYIRPDYSVRSIITNTKLCCWLFKTPVDWSVL